MLTNIITQNESTSHALHTRVVVVISVRSEQDKKINLSQKDT